MGQMIGRVRSAYTAFRGRDTSGAILLLAATIIAIAWANLGGHSYEEFWHTELAISLGSAEIRLSLQHWINDALMMLFFFLVSLEVKHDFIMGELREWRRASVPVIAALAGLIVPALLFFWFNAGGEGASAWGIVISTDTAFVMGILAVFGSRLPTQLRAFLVTLAVVDDVGALLVIATAYTETIHLGPLAVAGVVAFLLFLLQQSRPHRMAVYVISGVVLWLAVFASGVHATIAGVILGLLLPVFPPERSAVQQAEELTRVFRRTPVTATGSAAMDGIMRSVSINERLQLMLAPFVNLVVVPIFALSNAGVIITPQTLRQAFTSPLTWGIIVGLVVGKVVGIFDATVLATKLRIGELAPGVGYRHVGAGSILTGIGFTISLFIVDLALEDPVLQSEARIGVLAASLLSAGLGMLAMSATARYDAQHAPAHKRLNRPVDPERDHIDGPVNAPLTLVEYGRLGSLDDAAIDDVVQELRDYFGPELRFVYRHNPMDDPAAEQAALVIEAVSAQSRDLFSPMRQELGRLCQDEEIDQQMLRRAAIDVGANLPRLEEAMRQQVHAPRVHDDADDAISLGLTTAPTFFINGEIYEGPAETDHLIAALEAARDALEQQDEQFRQGRESADVPAGIPGAAGGRP
ncbi:Na+/H+ antiporter NhaA [Actinomyces viscosus]|uniref:Na+/H+ antiporter NhaA n=1 Tax=Actinomyces viscosus TaxID=1656 RepID=UPI0028E59DFC|nr:Na+/H+ antiporter NhaA [Actinomyces viscosus]